jgi:KipI family sensor histidine kinase inhibitor
MPIEMTLQAKSQPRILPNGDTALTVEFGRVVDEAVNRKVLAFDQVVAHANIGGILETVPTYRSLLVHYDPVVVDFGSLGQTLLELARQPVTGVQTAKCWRVPVTFGGEFGIDLEDVAKTHSLSPEDVIARYTARKYFVAMVGFTPGFAYLSGLDPSLATPRRSSPRIETPSGSIHIGGSQTGIQCLAGPSGWHLIGRTPVRTFQVHRDPMFLIGAGDEVTFYAVTARDFSELDRAAQQGELVAELVT